MFKRLSRLLKVFSGTEPKDDDLAKWEDDDRDAGAPVRVRRDPPDRGSSVAVAEPDDDWQL
jgi:hypothetical protein